MGICRDDDVTLYDLPMIDESDVPRLTREFSNARALHFLHVGVIIDHGSDIENFLTGVVALYVNPANQDNARAILQGRRLGDLIDGLVAVMPQMDGKDELVRQIRRVGAYRDQIAHSRLSPDIEKAMQGIVEHQLVRNRRRTAEWTSVNREAARIREDEARITSSIIQCMIWRLAGEHYDESVHEMVERDREQSDPEIIPAARALLEQRKTPEPDSN
jgi:predicted transposase YbfD/YdcC